MRGTTLLEPTFDLTPLPQMPRGRICVQDGCTTVLSVYNVTPFCGLHDSDDDAVVPPGFIRCRTCHRVLPWTLAYFHAGGHRDAGLHTSCKDCRNHRNRATKVHVPQPDSKRCPHCGMLKDLNRANFYWNITAGKFGSWCKVCVRDKARHRARVNADRARGGVGAAS